VGDGRKASILASSPAPSAPPGSALNFAIMFHPMQGGPRTLALKLFGARLPSLPHLSSKQLLDLRSVPNAA
jgi:hypothetical protein